MSFKKLKKYAIFKFLDENYYNFKVVLYKMQ